MNTPILCVNYSSTAVTVHVEVVAMRLWWKAKPFLPLCGTTTAAAAGRCLIRTASLQREPILMNALTKNVKEIETATVSYETPNSQEAASESAPVELLVAEGEVHMHQRLDYSTVIFLHGLLGSSLNWKMTMNKLQSIEDSSALPTEKRVRCYAVDLRNHGKSPHVPVRHGYKDLMEDVIHFMDHHSIPDCMLVGHSMGGKLAMMMGLHHPQRVRKIVVVDAAPVPYSHNHNEKFEAMLSIPLHSIRTKAEADLVMSELIADKGVRAYLLSNLVRRGGNKYSWTCNIDYIRQSQAKLLSWPAAVTAANGYQYWGDVMFVRSSETNYLTERNMEVARDLFPNAAFHTITGHHFAYAMNSAQFIPLLEQFLCEDAMEVKAKDAR